MNDDDELEAEIEANIAFFHTLTEPRNKWVAIDAQRVVAVADTERALLGTDGYRRASRAHEIGCVGDGYSSREAVSLIPSISTVPSHRGCSMQ